MGKAWDEFAKLAADKKVVVEVKTEGVPIWLVVLVVVFIIILYVGFNTLLAYRQGKRGCELLVHSLTACFEVIIVLMTHRNGGNHHHLPPPNQSDSTTRPSLTSSV